MSFRFVGTALSILGTGAGASGYYLTQGTASQPPAMVVPVTASGPSAKPPATAATPTATPMAPMAPMALTPPKTAPAPTASMPAMAATMAPKATAATAPPEGVRPRFVVAANDFWQPRVFVGPGTTHNPVTGAPLTREEQESGWVDGPEGIAREITVMRPDPRGSGGMVEVKEPNPEVMVLPGIDVVRDGPHHDEYRMVIAEAPAWVRSPGITLGPSVVVAVDTAPAPAATVMAAAPTPLPAPVAAPPPAPPAEKAKPPHHHPHAGQAAATHPHAEQAAAAHPTAGHAAPKHAAANHPDTGHADTGHPDTSPPAPDQAPASAAAAGAGGWHIHLASYRTAGRADQGWTQISHTLPAVLGALTPDKATVEIKGRGSFVRLLAGPFADRATAEHACVALAKAHLYCHAMGPGQEAS